MRYYTNHICRFKLNSKSLGDLLYGLRSWRCHCGARYYTRVKKKTWPFMAAPSGKSYGR